MHDTILQSIGRTPLIRLRKMATDVSATVAVKVESQNPGGSVSGGMKVHKPHFTTAYQDKHLGHVRLNVPS